MAADLPSTIAAIRLTIGAYCKPGDYIIMQSPYFTPLVEAIEGAGCHLLENRMLLKEEGYEIDFEDFERKIKPFKPAMFIPGPVHRTRPEEFSARKNWKKWWIFVRKIMLSFSRMRCMR